MSDVVVTVPKAEWAIWLAEGDTAGEPTSGREYFFTIGGRLPRVVTGDRVYVVAHEKLRGYAPLVRLDRDMRSSDRPRYALVRAGGAVAVTIPGAVLGFRGVRYRWWSRETERPFPEWRRVP